MLNKCKLYQSPVGSTPQYGNEGNIFARAKAPRFAIFSHVQRLDIRHGAGRGGAGGGVCHTPRTDPSQGCYTDLQHQAEERQRQRRSRRGGGPQQPAGGGTWMWGEDGEQGSSEVNGNAVLRTPVLILKAATSYSTLGHCTYDLCTVDPHLSDPDVTEPRLDM